MPLRTLAWWSERWEEALGEKALSSVVSDR